MHDWTFYGAIRNCRYVLVREWLSGCSFLKKFDGGFWLCAVHTWKTAWHCVNCVCVWKWSQGWRELDGLQYLWWVLSKSTCTNMSKTPWWCTSETFAEYLYALNVGTLWRQIVQPGKFHVSWNRHECGTVDPDAQKNCRLDPCRYCLVNSHVIVPVKIIGFYPNFCSTQRILVHAPHSAAGDIL